MAGTIRFAGDLAAWGQDARAARAALAVPSDASNPNEGRIRLRLEVSQILTAFGKEFDSEVDAMKARMAEALQNAGQVEADVRSAQAELDRVVALLRQTDRLDAVLMMAGNAATLKVEALPLPGSPLSILVGAHPQGGLQLVKLCPPDALAVGGHNLAVQTAVRNLALRLIGWGAFPAKPETAPPGGERLVALLVPETEEATAEFLDLRSGNGAAAARAAWDAATKSLDKEQAFFVRPIPGPENEKDVQLAQVIPNEGALKGGVSIVSRILGEVVLAAQESLDGVTATAVGRNPVNRLRQVRALVGRPEAALSGTAAFHRTAEGLPENPNAFFYVSPEGVTRWLRLGGMEAGMPSIGFMGGMSLAGGKISVTLMVPLDLPPHQMPR